MISVGIGISGAFLKSASTSLIQIIPQTNGKEERVVIQYGSGNSAARELAGGTYYFSDLKSDGTLFEKMRVQEMIRKAFPELDQSKVYDIAVTYDKNHAWDPVLGYVSKENGSYVLTPKLYENDNIVLLQYSGLTCKRIDIRNYMEMPTVLNKKASAKIDAILKANPDANAAFKE